MIKLDSHRWFAFPARASTFWPAVGAALALASGAAAQGVREVQPEGEDAKRQAREERKWDASFRLYGEYDFKTDLDDKEGKVSVARGGGVLDVGVPVGDRSRLGFTLQTEYSAYNFDHAENFGQGFAEPWDNVLEHSLFVILSSQATEKWSWMAGGAVRSSYETGADVEDSFTFAGIGAATYKFSDTFSLGLGLTVRSQLEDDVLVLPLILIDWKISEKWRFGGKAGGPGLVLTYQATDSLAFFLDGDLQRRAFRLDSDGPAPDGVGRDDRLIIAVGADWKISDQVRLSGRVGVTAWQEYDLLDKNGVQVTDREADPAPFVGLELRFDF